MSVQLRSSVDSLKNSTIAAQAPRQDWQNIPHINQLRPQGGGRDYVNGAFNCAPAVVAMLARAHGQLGHLNDAQLIQTLAKDIVTPEGTTPEGLTRMLARVNVPLAGKALGASYDEAALRNHLRAGDKLIAQVQSFDPKTRESSSHYVLIKGQTPLGNYIVSDPLKNHATVVTPSQLRKAVLNAPPDGGMLIPVTKPEAGVTGRTALAELTSSPAEQALRTQTGDMFEAVAPSRASLVLTPPQEQLLPDESAFQATDEVLRGVDTSFHEAVPSFASPALQLNEQRNLEQKRSLFTLDISYGRSSASGEKPATPVTPESMDEGAFAKDVLKLKQSGDQKAYDMLARLESSSFDRDKKVLRHVESEDKKQPGIGKKTTGIAF